MTSICVQMLEDILKRAKTEGFSSIFISITSENGNYYNWSAGEEEKQLELLQDAVDRFRAHQINWIPPAKDESLDASYACYHCNFVPRGFDFLTWLMTQEMYRIEADLPPPLKVAFWEGRHPDDNPHPRQWLNMVYRPLIKMIGAVEDDKAIGRLGSDVHVTRTLAAMYRIGAPLPELKAVGSYDLPKGCITITLRECDKFEHRNSDLNLWCEFANELKNQWGERVVFVRDTSKAEEPIAEQETSPLASIDLDARMWLYENAKMNFFVSNGPMMLAALTKNVPYVTFVMPEEMDSMYDANKPTFWKLKMGVPMGEQFPWSGNNQHIVWEKPTLDNLRRAYSLWLVMKNNKAA